MLDHTRLPVLARHAAALCVALLVTWAAPANEPTLLELKPRWKAGDAVRYEMARSSVREVEGKVVRQFRTRTPVEVEVVDPGAGALFLRWSQGSTVFDNPKHDTDPLEHALGQLLKALALELELDPEGKVVRLRNWRELRISGRKLRDEILAEMAKSPAWKSAVDPLRKETDKLFATKEALEAAFARTPALLAFPFGRKYELGQCTAYEGEIPNVFGGDEAFPASGQYTLKSFDKEAGCAVIVFKKAIDPKRAAPVLRRWLAAMAKQAGQAAADELPEIQIDDVIEYAIDPTGAIVHSVTHTRTSRISTTTQTETVTLTRKRK